VEKFGNCCSGDDFIIFFFAYDKIRVIEIHILFEHTIPVTAQSKTWICGRSLAGVAGSNLAAGIDVCLL